MLQKKTLQPYRENKWREISPLSSIEHICNQLSSTTLAYSSCFLKDLCNIFALIWLCFWLPRTLSSQINRLQHWIFHVITMYIHAKCAQIFATWYDRAWDELFISKVYFLSWHRVSQKNWRPPPSPTGRCETLRWQAHFRWYKF